MGAALLAHPKRFGLGRFTTSRKTGSLLAMHLLEVPLLGYLFFTASYAKRQADRRAMAHRISTLVGFANVVELGMFIFDGQMLLESFRRPHSPRSEKNIYAGAMSLFLAGTSLGVWVRYRLNDYLNPPVDPQFEHPRTEGELIHLVKKARALGVQLRMRGSGHCVPEGVGTDERGPHINVQLDRYTQLIGWEERDVPDGKGGQERRLRVTVQAGCHLGVDPNDPLSNKRNSLLWQLDKAGWALPDLGGISHQTVGGFISTGSMGGALGPSKGFSFGDAIVGLRVIDGEGQAHDLTPDDPATRDWFHAAGVSMGLVGIISTVTLECRRRYDIEGVHETHDAAKLFELDRLRQASDEELDRDPRLPKRLFEGGYRYTRLLWWPQQGVNKVEFWKANQREPTRNWGRRMVWQLQGWSKRRYRPFVSIPRFAQKLVIFPFFNFLAKEDPLPYERRNEELVSGLLKLFVREGKKEFHDSWHTGLPLDNQISDRHVPMVFTELFFPISQTDKLIKVLDEFFNHPDEEETRGMKRTGAFAFELYPGHQSDFWLSPCFGQRSIRLDVFWFSTRGCEDRHTRDSFFEQFWKLLRAHQLDFRPHWGKYMPRQDTEETRKAEARYLAARYPEKTWNAFLALRRKVDQEGIFLSRYWKERLGIEDASPSYPPPPPLVDGRKRRRVTRYWVDTLLPRWTRVENLGRRAWIRVLLGSSRVLFRRRELPGRSQPPALA